MDIDSSIHIFSANSSNAYSTVWGMPLYVCWIIIAVLLLISALFSSGENAFTNCNKYHYRAEAEKGNVIAKMITFLVDKFDGTLSTILVTYNAIQTLISFLSAMVFYNICAANGWLGLEAVLSTLVVGVLCYIFGDSIPKVISKAIPNQMACIVAFPVFILYFLLYPVVLIFRGILFVVQKIFHVKDENQLSSSDLIVQADEAVNDETLVEESEEEKEELFENDEIEILGNVMKFDKRKVRDVYTSLEKTLSLPIDGLTADIVNDEIVHTDYSRIPVYQDDKENIIGILVIRSYFEEYMKDPHLSIPSMLEKTVFLDIDMNLDDAFEELNSESVHLGVVKEGDKTVGIISMEDILEEIVSNIAEDPTKEDFIDE